MSQNSGLRHRNPNKKENRKKVHEEENKYEEFVTRESPLTILIESSLHLRAIYHIFVVILLMLFCETLIFDFIDRGKINVGVVVIVEGFGDVKRGIKLWLYDQMVALAFYPMLILYAWLGKSSRKYQVLRPTVVMLGWLGFGATLFALTAIPVHDLARKHLEIGSSTAVTCEMAWSYQILMVPFLLHKIPTNIINVKFRFIMKIVAVAAACGPRCLDGKTPLPSFQHYLYFMFAPTLLYRDQYPRTTKVRWGKVILHIAEVVAIVFYNSFLWERFILPYWSDYGKTSSVDAGTVVRAMFACVLPGLISFLCGFYCVLHAWLNAFAEILKFGDRLFYEEWWTTSMFSSYYRRWNRVVYSWLRDHIYHPMAPHLGRPMATLTVFLISSVAHEVILALSFGFFYPVLLVEFGVLGLIMVPLTANVGRRYPNTFNLLMWMSFFIGNGILWSLYPMEYFARKNCPPSENDSFFIPKSWSCPEVILKPDWTFQNPFHVLF